MLLKIYLIFCVITFLLSEMCIYKITQEIKREYKDILQEIKLLEGICPHIKMFIMSFIPIINLSLFYVVLFQIDKIKNITIDKIKIDTQIKQNSNN